MFLRGVVVGTVLLGLGAVAHPSPDAVGANSSGAADSAATAIASAHRARILPLAEVHPGMTGYGLTVFEGTKPERFNVRVIGVLHNFLPKQDVILIQSDDPRLLHSGIVHGMSGSPIYLDGKLVG